MYNLANEFEVCAECYLTTKGIMTDAAQVIFKERLADAKAVVEEPHQPTLKIKMGAPANPIKLRLNAKESPAPQSDRATPESRGTPGMGVDTAALERQKAHVAAAVNGQRPPSAGKLLPSHLPQGSFSSLQSVSTGAASSMTQGSDAGRSASAGSPPAMTNGVKAESQPPSGTMPPPSLARVPSGSPHPQVGAVQPPALAQPQPAPPATGYERRYREPGKSMFTTIYFFCHIEANPFPLQLRKTHSCKASRYSHIPNLTCRNPCA